MPHIKRGFPITSLIPAAGKHRFFDVTECDATIHVFIHTNKSKRAILPKGIDRCKTVFLLVVHCLQHTETPANGYLSLMAFEAQKVA